MDICSSYYENFRKFLVVTKFSSNWIWLLANLVPMVVSLVVLSTQVGFAEFNNTADNRANIGGIIIGAPIVGQ